ncbi:MAG: sigma-70 family RNA polymerase sigma factor [Ignavibacteriaceae bacterium]|jgi:RNA polymerase sigma factor for flagellar operon FliA
MDNSQLWNEYKVSPTPELKKKIMMNYTRLVHYVIHNSRFINLDILDDRDYFQFGIEGLSEAIDRFDPDYGTKFETYAIQRIRGKIIDELRKLQKKRTSPDGVNYNNVSLNNTIDEDENYTLSDIIPSSYDSPNEEVEKNEAIEFLTEAIKNLPERDRMIISLYYYEHLNYQEISKILSITVSRVSQVHSKIIKTLKTRLAYLNV